MDDGCLMGEPDGSGVLSRRNTTDFLDDTLIQDEGFTHQGSLMGEPDGPLVFNGRTRLGCW